MITSSAWKNEKYAVLGLARSGRATVEALLAAGADVLVWDDRAEAREPFASRCAIGDPLAADLTGFAGVVVSPGVPLNAHPIKPHADAFGVPVIGDIELFSQARGELPPHKVVGITGTNGKSTTTALVHHILKEAGVPTAMGGNIGLPILEQQPLPEGGVYVLELSSYQIDLTHSLDCDVAVLLNITPDHLDRYENFGAYRASKLRLFDMQSCENLSLVGDGQLCRTLVAEGRFTYPVGLDEGATGGNPVLAGPHNQQNTMAARLICVELHVMPQKIDSGVATYPGLPHRMERVAEIAGVAYVNDSKGTNTAASAPALAAFHNIHWILGGLAKEAGLGECEAQLHHVKAAYTIGKAGPAFAALLESIVQVERCETLDRAIASAAAKAQAGDTVLLSPACASFDQYRDFEARGEHFRELVGALR